MKLGASWRSPERAHGAALPLFARRAACGSRALYASPSSRPNVGPSVNGLALYPFQVDGIRWLTTRRRALLADEMGLGKTVQLLRALDRAGAIVVCPAFLRLVWRDAAAEWRPDLTPIVARPGTLPRPRSGELVITSYDGLPEPASRGRLVAAPLETVTLVLDEAQYAKSPDAMRTRLVRLLGRQVRRIWAATGTPVHGSAADLWGVLESARLARQAFGSYATFAGSFGPARTRWDELGDQPASDVPERLARVMLRRMKRQVLPELPPKTYADHPVPVPEELRQSLDRADAAWRVAGTDRLPPFELLSGVRRELAIARIPAAHEVAERYEAAGVPLVVFSAHVDPVLSLGAREGWGAIVGDVAEAERAELVRQFQAGELRGLALGIRAGGVGITLTHASHVLFVDLAYTPSDNAQCEDRVVRIGQTASSVVITRMVADHAVDRRLLSILGRKRELAAAALGDKPT